LNHSVSPCPSGLHWRATFCNLLLFILLQWINNFSVVICFFFLFSVSRTFPSISVSVFPCSSFCMTSVLISCSHLHLGLF
jgi:hypothetical protein